MLGRDDYSGCCSPQGFPLLIVQLPSTKIGSELDALTATSGKNKSGELFFLNCDNPSDSTICQCQKSMTTTVHLLGLVYDSRKLHTHRTDAYESPSRRKQDKCQFARSSLLAALAL